MAEFKIRRAAVLGAGVMGSKIAAHLANAGIPSYLLDVAPSELTSEEQSKGLTLDSLTVRNRIVQAGWKSALNSKPAALFSPELASLVRTGNFTDNLGWVGKADWIVEAVTENLEVKRKLFEQVESHRRPGTPVSSNTSGIPIHSIAEGFSEDFRKHFLGTHFFNPPRYLKLLEIIPTPATDPALTHFLVRFGEDQLGKGVVLCKDTPNFIANRIATHGICVLFKAMVEEDLTVEEVDLLTGPVLGRPKSATFRTFDVVGVDTFVFVIRNLHDLLSDPAEREIFTVPAFVQTMLQNRWLGDKTGQGFYKKVRSDRGTEIQYLDYHSMEYRPTQGPRFPALDKIKKLPALEKRLRKLVFGSDKAGKFLWRVLSSSLTYAASKIPEISEDIVSVDRAMKWGFLHKLGPFETWDALGVETVAKRLQEEQRPIPPLVQGVLASGKNSFYKRRSGKTLYFEPATAAYVKEPERPGVIVLSSFRTRNRIVRQNPSASLLDLGDGVACLEFHSKMNSVDADIIRMMNEAVEEVSRNFEGLVIANDGDNFSAGANLVEVLGASRAGKWDAIDEVIRSFQQANSRLRYSEKPVVAAPHQMALGGGCEIVIQSDQVHAAAELYIGFVEVGVGLVPAGGGCMEMVSRAAQEAGSDSDTDLFPRIRKVFELIGTARVSGSASEARGLGLLSERDHVSMNQDQRIYHAKQDVLALVREGYRPPVPRNDIPVLGQPGLASLKLGLHTMERAGYISAYDKEVGTQLAVVLTGGAFLGTRKVSEQHLRDLEREAFLTLCGQQKTQERMEHMLREGKPLRN
jgi:3-hydroxyacyl-CoA dehydrogenase